MYKEYIPCLLIFGLSYYNFLSILDVEDFKSKNYFQIKEVAQMARIMRTIVLDVFWNR